MTQDLNVPVAAEPATRWGETRFFGCYAPADDVGIYVHAGRFRQDRGLWWVHLAVYLPDGSMLVDRSWGRDAGPEVVRTGCFELRQEGDGFRSRFDGAGELTTLTELTRSPRGAGAGLARVRWEVRFVDLGPLWDLYAVEGGHAKEEFAGDSHSQRTFSTDGSLEVDGDTYSLRGVGWRDHSSGVRAWSGYGGHQAIWGVFDDRWIHALTMLAPDGSRRPPLGRVFHRDGRRSELESFAMETISDLECGPRAGTLHVKARGETAVDIDYEIRHLLPITINDDGDNLNGIDWESPAYSAVLGEGVARLTLPDGSVGHAFLERGIPRDDLTDLG
jgi:hypothetical protein